ncbi:MFS general substrate transporter [Aspergillus pseudonomiae]|uniref:MFS general substrate transporter n=1 Tax=Aspergillus pseudonomiae TaxID=1506151 RepID=A0A5N6HSF5_9EURO|nr:MFS general substrate transporter [Aspergillus pseudonomiae]KAB8256587.1 MFS general substrate transporter [Aspergillus pseudonomiae]KAE8405454.1 MFS general substrate transporter [Aspergillus pseudonomiae]
MHTSSDSQKVPSATGDAASSSGNISEDNHTSIEYTEEDSSEFPDGGWRAWSVVLGSWCALLPSFGLMNITGILEEWLADHQLQNYSKASISWIFSLWLFLFYLGGIQTGPVFDSHGVKYTLLPGCVGFTASIMILSVAQAYYQFILGFSVLGGLSASAILPPAFGTINHWFYRRRGLATGVSSTCGGIGGIILTYIFGTLRDRIGFPWAVRVLGFLFLGCFIVSLFLTRTRLPSNNSKSCTIDLRSLREPAFTMTSLAVTAAEVGLMVVITYLPSYASSHGLTGSLSYELMSIFSATSIPGRVIPGLLADRWGRFNVMIATGSVCTILILALWLTANESKAAIISFAAFFGFWAGPAISLSPVCVAQISKTGDYGKRYGTTNTIMALCLLVAIPVAGEILKVQNPSTHQETVYWGLIVFSGLSYACSTLFLILAKGVSVGWTVTRIF